MQHYDIWILLSTSKNAFLNHKTPYLQSDLCSQRGHVNNITLNHQVVLKLPCVEMRGGGSTNPVAQLARLSPTLQRMLAGLYIARFFGWVGAHPNYESYQAEGHKIQ